MPTSPAIEARGRSRDRDRSGGFTLIETVLALAVIGLVAALSLPYVRPQSSPAALRAKAFEIASLLRTERNRAISSGREAHVLIDVDGGALEAVSSRIRIVVPQSVRLRLSPEGARGLTFRRDGRASQIELALVGSGSAYTVRVNPLTAAVNVSGR